MGSLKPFSKVQVHLEPAHHDMAFLLHGHILSLYVQVANNWAVIWMKFYIHIVIHTDQP